MYVYVHIWDADIWDGRNNVAVYGSHTAALDGIAKGYEGDAAASDATASLEHALSQAKSNPGEAVFIDGGVSSVRYLSVHVFG